ncbi:MAG: alpha-mannosidase [Actinobacteria bacterium 13_2_20CM_2_71_6]|nr:MAG: alpha-mannosidase [Actinobacteria bacterium 13_2_20CM_2_71_6]
MVNPFSGTQPGGPDFGTGGGAENTFPGADVPFGMVQWSPDTMRHQDGGYYYPDNRIKGFSLTHFSGAGCSAAEDIPFLPFVGQVTTSPATDLSPYVSTFSHDREAASPGYYGVTLDSGPTMELTTTPRSGMGRITYPITNQATLLVNVSGSVNGVTDAQVDVGRNTISGWATSGHFCGGGNVYRVYFSATFDKPFASIGTWHNDAVSHGSASVRSGAVPATVPASPQKLRPLSTARPPAATPNVSVSGPGSGAFVTFDASHNRTVNVRVGLSYVSVANAAANAKAEQGSKNFDTVARAARAAWNARLGQIQVTGGTPAQRTILYTELYHSLLQPNVFSDVNGDYIGFDGMAHKMAKGHAQYANFSGWDVYSSEIQLIALLAPHEAGDMAQSMFNQAHQSGDVWDRWSQNNDFEGVMTGDPYHSMVASAYAFGGTDFDATGALASMVHGATTVQKSNVRYMERPGLGDYQTLGYLPGDPSTTLEYTSADFGIATLAQRLGQTQTYQQFISRAQHWENLFNPANGYLQPRNRDGSFMAPFDPASPNMYVEGNGAQYTWMVPYDYRGLFNAMGGDAAVRQRLDTFFTQLNAGTTKPYAFLGNEPSLNVPWAYDYAGAPYRTQAVVRQALNTLWRPTADGFVGNNDLGEMSSWYVWGALGLYPEAPGRAELVLGSPLFPHIVVTRPGGQTITIDAPGASADTYYVQSLSVNGTASTRPWLPESFVQTGGTLSFALGSTPNTAWGSDPADAPPSFRDGEVPYRTAVDPGHVSIEPGGAAVGAKVTVQTIVGAAGTVSWTANPPAGITVTPSSGTIDVPASGPASAQFSISVAAGVTPGFSHVPVTLHAADGSALPDTAVSLTVARVGTLLWYYNNTGVSDDNAPGGADLDGGGFSYSEQALVAAGARPGGQVNAGSFSFTWPADPVALPDNIMVGGGNQTLDLSGTPATATKLALLGSGTNGNVAGTLTITYTDGTTQAAQVGFGDWTLGGGGEGLQFGNVVAAATPYRNSSGGPQQVFTYVFATAPIALQAGKQVASVTLPATTNGGDMHVFSIATA